MHYNRSYIVKSQVISRGRALFYILVFMLSSVLIGCETVDERELCCEEVVLIYRYVPTVSSGDRYRDNIRTMRHFLYDASGRYLREVPSHPRSPQRMVLRNLPFGDYTMLTVANASSKTLLELEVKSLSEARLFTANRSLSLQSDTDDLFYNYRHFRSEDRKREYYCDLSNVHCHLHVMVGWEGKPPYHDSDYRLEARRINSSYTLTPDPDMLCLNISQSRSGSQLPRESSYRDVVHHFPFGREDWVEHADGSLYYNQRAFFEIVSLRYTDIDIPTIQLFHGDEALTDPLDLTKSFRAWLWYPDDHPEQIYRIKLIIKENGDVLIYPWSGMTDVLDWEDGGSFGTQVG